MKSLIATAGAALVLAACATTDDYGRTTRNNTATGALIGAGAGALAGVLAGGDDRRNAILGAGIGALAGAGIGQYMDRQQRALEEQLSGSGVGVQREGDNLRLVMPSDITFDTGSASLDPSFNAVLDDVAAVFVEYPSTYVDVAGHADSRGAEDFNQTLSYNRAMSVANFLNARGVQPERFAVQGMGETSPVASNDTETGRAANRRVEILLRPYTG